MANTYKRLGACVPSAIDTETTLYQVPTSTTAYLDACGVTCCNQGTSDITFRIARVDGGTTTANEDWVVFDQTIAGKSSFTRQFLVGAAFGAQDSIIIRADSTSISFTVGGVEMT